MLVSLKRRPSWPIVLLAAALLGIRCQSQAAVHFVVAEMGAPVHGDSYILPLDDSADIAHARDLIDRGLEAGATIAVARIAKGADGINRNILAPGEPLWSWHVAGFEGFADSTIEVLDGWPTFVEQDVDAWIANTNGHIGFWSYTVTAEVASIPEPGALILVASALAGMFGLRLVMRVRRGWRTGN
jgi:hypothetical protein